MKRIFLTLFIIICFSFTSCKNESTKISIASPLGAPALASACLAYDIKSGKNDKYTFETLANTTDVKAAFIAKSYDFIFAPTNIGAQIYNMDKSYKLVSGITFGNLYFVSKFEIDSINDFVSRDIFLFGKNTINDVICNKVLNNYNIDLNIKYNDSVNTNKTAFLADTSNAIYLLAEPVKSAMNATLDSKGISMYEISVEEEMEKISGFKGFAQSGLFVKSTIEKSAVEEVSSIIKDSINNILKETNKKETNKKIKDLGYYDLSDEVMYNAIINSNIDFVIGEDLINIFNYTYKDNLSLIGDKMPDYEFYYN